MIRVVAVKANSRAAKIIQFGLNEQASHLAVDFGGSVIHSHMQGVHAVGSIAFWDTYQLVDQTIFDLGTNFEKTIYDSMIMDIGGEPYDVPAFVYFTYRAALRRFFNVAFPEKNKGQLRDAYLCVGVLKSLLKAFEKISGKPIALTDFEMLSPLKCVKFLRGISL